MAILTGLEKQEAGGSAWKLMGGGGMSQLSTLAQKTSGGSINVIFKEALVQMDLHEYQLEAVETAMFGFVGHAVYPEGEITLPLTLGTRDLRKTVMTIFTMVDVPYSYNIIFGRLATNEMRAIASTYHQKIKYPKKERREEKGKRESQVDEVAKEREVHFVAEEEQEAVEIEPGKHIRELAEISPHVAEHKLNIIVGSQPMKQKKRCFGLEKDKVINEQVKELLRAGHIREVQYPTWLSNVFLVPKATGK
ncbi:uncharacterized protein [Primulina eburnea]|uniref:uncharacterized protein n=1 Tax=Primulina eburnea TaxID=1245227 RepID=UPI003C6C7050